ncbi:MAG: NAD-dependent epimerase/dehydratase family protein [Candidatus Altiarchaeota archaeon]
MAKVFVTGASGFIGSNLVRRLVEDGHDVSAMMNRHPYHPLLEGVKFERVVGNLTEPTSFREALAGCDTVYHCAALITFRGGYNEPYKVNVEGTRNILDVSLGARVRRFVFTSACVTLGISKSPDVVLDESSKFAPPKSWVYANTKHLAEEMVMSYSKKGMDTVSLNPSTVYGAGDHSLNSGFTIKKVAEGKAIFAPPGGTSYVSVNDVVDAHILAMNKGVSGERYIISRENLTYKELFNRIADAVKSTRVKYVLPKILRYPAYYPMVAIEQLITPPIPSRLIDELFIFKYYNNQKAVRELVWAPKEDLGAAVLEAVEYYRKYNLF